MWCHRQDVAIAIQCVEAIFSLIGEDGEEIIEGFDIFNYLGRPMEWSDDD